MVELPKGGQKLLPILVALLLDRQTPRRRANAVEEIDVTTHRCRMSETSPLPTEHLSQLEKVSDAQITHAHIRWWTNRVAHFRRHAYDPRAGVFDIDTGIAGVNCG